MGSENVSFAQLCEWTGLAYDLNLMSVEDHDELNAIDKLFAERTQTLSEFFVSGSKSAFQRQWSHLFGKPFCQ